MNKLISRITCSDYDDEELHKMSFGISSDPLTHFALVLSSLLHDCGHIGCTNAQLCAEDHPLAAEFNYKSIAVRSSSD
jgi:hypothetical protein